MQWIKVGAQAVWVQGSDTGIWLGVGTPGSEQWLDEVQWAKFTSPECLAFIQRLLRAHDRATEIEPNPKHPSVGPYKNLTVLD